MHQEESCKNTKAKGVGMLRMLCPGQSDIHHREILENHDGIQFVGFAPSLGHR